MVNQISTQSYNKQEPLVPTNVWSRSGIVTLDTYYDDNQCAGGIHIGTAGDIILEGVDGEPNVFINASGLLLFKHTRVLTSVTINAVEYTTAATGLTWVGGKA